MSSLGRRNNEETEERKEVLRCTRHEQLIFTTICERRMTDVLKVIISGIPPAVDKAAKPTI
jgi:hypothetical protein